MPVLRTDRAKWSGGLWFETPDDQIARSREEIREGTLLWRLDNNRRVFSRESRQMFFRSNFTPVRVVGESPKSWLVVDLIEDQSFLGVHERSERRAIGWDRRQRKVSKADLLEAVPRYSPFPYVLSVEDEVFRHETSHLLVQSPWDDVDIAKLRQIAAIMGWPLVPQQEQP